jgi:hypothetical protein
LSWPSDADGEEIDAESVLEDVDVKEPVEEVEMEGM